MPAPKVVVGKPPYISHPETPKSTSFHRSHEEKGKNRPIYLHRWKGYISKPPI